MSRQSSTKSERRKRLDKRRAQRKARDARLREMLDGYLAARVAEPNDPYNTLLYGDWNYLQP